MKTIGIIAEYNPFHNGHLYQLRRLRSETKADFIIAAMSGDFVQRGKPAVYDKYTRTRMALSAGVDIVLELPVCFATGSAREFAACGVALFDHLGVVDLLGFGSESGDYALLSQAASVLAREPEEFTRRLQMLLKQGISFPSARADALKEYLKGQGVPCSDMTALLSAPNNILGMEYLAELIRRGSSIKPVTVRRSGQDYHDTAPVSQDICASASAVRKAIREGRMDVVCDQIPENAAQVFKDPLPPVPVFSDDLTPLLNSRLLDLIHADSPDSFDGYADLSPELCSRLKRRVLDFSSFSGRVMQLKTRSYTYTRISRALLHLLLGITREQVAHYKTLDYAPYARLLGFRRQAGPLLGQIKQRSSIPLITKTADARKILDADSLSMLQTDFHASHLYQSVLFSKAGRVLRNEYTRSVIIL